MQARKFGERLRAIGPSASRAELADVLTRGLREAPELAPVVLQAVLEPEMADAARNVTYWGVRRWTLPHEWGEILAETADLSDRLHEVAERVAQRVESAALAGTLSSPLPKMWATDAAALKCLAEAFESGPTATEPARRLDSAPLLAFLAEASPQLAEALAVELKLDLSDISWIDSDCIVSEPLAVSMGMMRQLDGRLPSESGAEIARAARSLCHTPRSTWVRERVARRSGALERLGRSDIALAERLTAVMASAPELTQALLAECDRSFGLDRRLRDEVYLGKTPQTAAWNVAKSLKSWVSEEKLEARLPAIGEAMRSLISPDWAASVDGGSHCSGPASQLTCLQRGYAKLDSAGPEPASPEQAKWADARRLFAALEEPEALKTDVRLFVETLDAVFRAMAGSPSNVERFVAAFDKRTRLPADYSVRSGTCRGANARDVTGEILLRGPSAGVLAAIKAGIDAANPAVAQDHRRTRRTTFPGCSGPVGMAPSRPRVEAQARTDGLSARVSDPGLERARKFGEQLRATSGQTSLPGLADVLTRGLREAPELAPVVLQAVLEIARDVSPHDADELSMRLRRDIHRWTQPHEWGELLAKTAGIGRTNRFDEVAQSVAKRVERAAVPGQLPSPLEKMWANDAAALARLASAPLPGPDALDVDPYPVSNPSPLLAFLADASPQLVEALAVELKLDLTQIGWVTETCRLTAPRDLGFAIMRQLRSRAPRDTRDSFTLAIAEGIARAARSLSKTPRESWVRGRVARRTDALEGLRRSDIGLAERLTAMLASAPELTGALLAGCQRCFGLPVKVTDVVRLGRNPVSAGQAIAVCLKGYVPEAKLEALLPVLADSMRSLITPDWAATVDDAEHLSHEQAESDASRVLATLYGPQAPFNDTVTALTKTMTGSLSAADRFVSAFDKRLGGPITHHLRSGMSRGSSATAAEVAWGLRDLRSTLSIRGQLDKSE